MFPASIFFSSKLTKIQLQERKEALHKFLFTICTTEKIMQRYLLYMIIDGTSNNINTYYRESNAIAIREFLHVDENIAA
jgi:hypothetical protein